MSSHTITQHPFRIQNWCRLFGNIKIMVFQIFVRHNVISGYFNTKAEKQKRKNILLVYEHKVNANWTVKW